MNAALPALPTTRSTDAALLTLLKFLNKGECVMRVPCGMAKTSIFALFYQGFLNWSG